MADPKAPGDGYDVLINRLAAQERRMDELEIATGTQRNRTTANLPVPGVGTFTTSNIGLPSSTWVTYATVTIPVPAGKTTATIMAFANGAFLDMTSGGVTSISARIIIGDVVSPAAPGSKDAGASRVNNIVQIGYVAVLTGVSGTVSAQLQVNPLNASAFPAQAQNFALITINAAFTA